MSDEEQTVDAETPPEADASRLKKVVTRKPVWVCIPIEFEEIHTTDGNDNDFTIRRPSAYTVTKCPGGKGQAESIRAVLTKHEIDPTNYEHVLLLRAEPLEFKIEKQLIVRFSTNP